MKNIFFTLIATFVYSVASQHSILNNGTGTDFVYPVWVVAIFVAVIGWLNCTYIKRNKWRQQAVIALIAIVITSGLNLIWMSIIPNVWIMATVTSISCTVINLFLSIVIPVISRAKKSKYNKVFKNIIAVLNSIGIYCLLCNLIKWRFVVAIITAVITVIAIFSVSSNRQKLMVRLTAAFMAASMGAALGCYATLFMPMIIIAPISECFIYNLFVKLYNNPSEVIEPSNNTSQQIRQIRSNSYRNDAFTAENLRNIDVFVSGYKYNEIDEELINESTDVNYCDEEENAKQSAISWEESETEVEETSSEEIKEEEQITEESHVTESSKTDAEPENVKTDPVKVKVVVRRVKKHI